MTLKRGLKALLIFVVVMALICTAVILGAPIAARELTLQYLARSGVDADIGNVDVDLFAGTIAYDDIHGESQAGGGFQIGHLAANIDYPPLLSKQVVLTRLALEDARIDIHRTAEDIVTVGGITVLSPDQQSSGSMNWGVALKQLTVAGLAIHYTQPALGDMAAIDRTLVFNKSSARDVVTWERDNDVPVDADLSVGDGRIRLKGRITPFGKTLSAHFEIETENFALDLLTPITRGSGLESLTGTVDADQQVDIEYAPDSGMDIAIDGAATWLDSRLVLASGPTFSSSRSHWKGRFDMHLLQDREQTDAVPAAQPVDTPPETDAVDPGKREPAADEQPLQTEGALALTPLLQMAGSLPWVPIESGNQTLPLGPSDDGPADFVMDAEITIDDLKVGGLGGVSLRQQHGQWNGKSQLTLGKTATTLQTDSRLTTRGTALTAANGTTVKTRDLDWQGKTSADVAPTFKITGNGRLKLGALSIDVPQGVNTQTDALDFNGTTRVSTGGGTVQVHTDGDIDTRRLHTALPNTLQLDAEHLSIKGTTDTDVGTTATEVATDGAMTASRFVFDITDTAGFDTDDIDWRGTTRTQIGELVGRSARGHLIAGGARLSLPGTDVALTADRLVYDGNYSETPDNAGNTLLLRMQGGVDGHRFNIMNTAIGAPWVSTLQIHGDNLSIDGLNRIGVDAIEASGVGLLGDTDSNVAVLEAITASARNFRLDDLLHYRFNSLDMNGTNIHLTRDRNGMGVISRFLADDNEQDASTAQTDNSPSASYAFDTLNLSGPAFTFTDTAVEPRVTINGADLNLAVEDLDTAQPDRDASFRLAVDVGAYGHLDSRGTIAPMASGGLNMNIDAWLRSLAMTPLSGYLNAALGRKIANGAADGTLNLKASNGQLDGNLDTTLSNFRLADSPHADTTVALGISLDTALALVRGQNDAINFQTLILGDVTNPYFSVKNLVREAVLAGLRTAILSDYSPLGLLNRAKNAVLNIGRSLVSRPAEFRPGRHYIRPEDREYLGRIAQAMNSKPGIRLTVQGHAVPNDADQMSFFHGASVDEDNRVSLQELAARRGQAVRDYLAARNVNPDHIILSEPVVDEGADAKPQATFSIKQ